MVILVTGAAGFIGMHVAQRCLAEGHTVVGVDNLNDYYSVELKESRLAVLHGQDNFTLSADPYIGPADHTSGKSIRVHRQVDLLTSASPIRR